MSWFFKQLLLQVLFIEQSEPHDRESCKEDIVKLVKPGFIERLPSKGWTESKPKLRKYEHNILIEDIANQKGISSVSLSSMGKQKILQEFKLPDSIIGWTSSLLTFKTTDTDANMCSSNHVYIISSITNREGGGSRMLILDEWNDLSLLLWWNSASKDNLYTIRKLDKLLN
jgi:hypothetical protein